MQFRALEEENARPSSFHSGCHRCELERSDEGRRAASQQQNILFEITFSKMLHLPVPRITF